MARANPLKPTTGRRRLDFTRAQPFAAAQVPAAAGRRAFEEKGRTLRPLAGPSVPLPPDQDQALEERFQAWTAAFRGSMPEFIVWEWLIFNKRQQYGVDFLYQYPTAGGRTAFGGEVLDFYFPQRNTAWNVQGLRWHWTKPEDRARDQILKQLLGSRGIAVIFLWEDDLYQRPDLTLEAAWRGEELNVGRDQ